MTGRLTYAAEELVFSGVPWHECSHSTRERCRLGPHNRVLDTRGLHTSWLHLEEWVARLVVGVGVGTGQQVMNLS